ncbi:PAT complex subunit CCDC47 [Onthophagus taurus]|uniref:PAT complex subunit CCDC47 n=1 Tax=Onthophagus taurus TaxID=166361 RepID=UPI000C200F80|nr:coiled-coil domain-containing protein 47 [Onthophagus taurus]
MKFFLVLSLLLFSSSFIKGENYADLSDNEFAEFEEFDSDEFTINERDEKEKPINIKENHLQDEEAFVSDDEEGEVIIEDDSEFEHFQDTEEFEGFADTKDERGDSVPKITITTVPVHFRANWDSYWLEILMITGLVVYFLNFAAGKSKNTKIANAWYQTHKTLLEDNFCLVGDDGVSENSDNINMLKESENIFTLWCSGRTCCEGMLVELKLIKRQDLVAIIAGMMRPTADQIHVKVIMNKEDMDTFVFCIASKKTAAHLSKEMNDLSIYSPERKPGEKFNIPSTFNVMGEIAEATSALLDSKITAVLNKYSDLVDYIHFSDQYSGVKQPDDNGAIKLPDTQKVLLFGFNIPKVKGAHLNESMEQLKPLFIMIFYCIEKIKRYRLSKEGKNKADKNRQRVEEAFLKSTHAARAEAAAARREEKRRLEKEKVMAEDDPEKQRRWEEKEQKRQAKKRAPKMKQLKVKAL